MRSLSALTKVWCNESDGMYSAPRPTFEVLKDAPRIRWLGVGLSLSRQGFDFRQDDIGFVVEEVALGPALSEYEGRTESHEQQFFVK